MSTNSKLLIWYTVDTGYQTWILDMHESGPILKLFIISLIEAPMRILCLYVWVYLI